jgi:hypothetical protein
VWSLTKEVCINENSSDNSNAINCQVINFTQGNLNDTECRCTPGFYWNSNACIINCSTVRNSAGTINEITCACLPGFTFFLTFCV